MQVNDTGAASIRVIGASAGTGKTYRLASAFVDAVCGKTADCIEPSKILAVTFTNKAADELIERIRHLLIERGQPEYAQQAGAAYVGTVNSICGRLLKEHAFEAGLSPEMNVVPPEEVSSMLAVAADRAVDFAADEIEEAAARLSLPEWKETIGTITMLARANAISQEKFENCAQQSWNGLQLLLPAQSILPPDQLDNMLAASIEKAIEELGLRGDDTVSTKNVNALLKDKQASLKSGRHLGWNEWAQLTKLKPGKESLKLVQPVIDCARHHAKHPRLHEDINRFISAIFRCSASALGQYEEFKRSHGFIDFTDQECLTLQMLDLLEVRQSICERIQLVLVDEFQDTSPIQLAIFSKLASLAKQTIWVGDEKQAIYGFRGTDPELMSGVVSRLQNVEGAREQLEKSYRSRPALIHFTNDLFGPAFESLGIPERHVCISQHDRADDPLHRNGVTVCRMQGKSASDTPNSTAEFVKEVLSSSDLWLVEGKDSKRLRSITGHDIAILCRTNEHCAMTAESLARHGIKASTQRSGLMQTPECIFSFAALRYLVDRGDTLAMAEILHLSRNDSAEKTWLSDWLALGREDMRGSSAELLALDEARNGLMHLTPVETLEIALSAVGVTQRLKGWGNVRSRLSNVDALRGLASRFEDVCLAQRRAATPAGLVTYLLREVPGGGQQPPSLDEDAVQILTYHGAKGLEFPMVVLLDLEKTNEPTPFGVFAETAGGIIDANDPLKDRWVRFWPWPYGQQRKDVHLDGTASGCAEMNIIRKREHAENMRLLYVGTTRARDYLILGCSKDTGWLDSLKDSRGGQVLRLPAEHGIHSIEVGAGTHELAVDVRKLPMTSSLNAAPASSNAVYAMSEEEKKTVYPAFRCQPSGLIDPRSATAVGSPRLRIHGLGSRISINGTADIQVIGDLLHAFFAADGQSGSNHEVRLELANRLLSTWNVTQLEAGSLLEMSDRLNNFLQQQYPSCRISREHAVFGNIGGQRVRGRIDLLVETDHGFAIVDHKTFPGAYDQWTARATSYRPQLAMYGELVAQATGLPLLALLVHLPIIGSLVDVTDQPQDQ